MQYEIKFSLISTDKGIGGINEVVYDSISLGNKLEEGNALNIFDNVYNQAKHYIQELK